MPVRNNGPGGYSRASTTRKSKIEPEYPQWAESKMRAIEKQDVLQSYAMSSTECRPSVLEKLRMSAERTPARAIKDKEAEIC